MVELEYHLSHVVCTANMYNKTHTLIQVFGEKFVFIFETKVVEVWEVVAINKNILL